MKVVNCQGAVRHSDTFNFGTRSHVDGFKYWNPSQPQPDIFQSPSEELVVENFSPSLHTWRQRKDRLAVIKHPAKRKSTVISVNMQRPPMKSVAQLRKTVLVFSGNFFGPCFA